MKKFALAIADLACIAGLAFSTGFAAGFVVDVAEHIYTHTHTHTQAK